VPSPASIAARIDLVDIYSNIFHEKAYKAAYDAIFPLFSEKGI
jgi:hypothetical protein